MARFGSLGVLLTVCIGAVWAQPTTEEIRRISDQIWNADVNRIDGDDVQYNVNDSRLFTYVNEARFTGTYASLIALLDNYIPETGIAETCGATCQNERNAFLDAIIRTPALVLLQNFLWSHGLASPSIDGFKEELRQYFFMDYSRSSGAALDSSGFEHVFVGEIRGTTVLGLHNWVQVYFEEKSGDFQYNALLRTCPNEVYAFSLTYLGVAKPVSGMFIRTSPEVEVALYTLCLLTRVGTGCPVRRNGVDQAMTVWDMTGLPKTIGSAYPNC